MKDDIEKGPLLDENKVENDDDADDIKKNSQPGAIAKSISSCALYSFCSVSMVLVNKSLASR